MKVPSLALLVILLISFTASGEEFPDWAKWRIVPGDSIGWVKLNTPLSRAREIMLRYGPVEENVTVGIRIQNKGNIGVLAQDSITIDTVPHRSEPGTAVGLFTSDPRFKLPNGIGVGGLVLETFGRLSAEYGKPYVKDAIHIWSRLGLWMETGVSANNPGRLVIKVIGVFEPAP